MQLKVLPSTKDDIEDMIRVMFAAFSSDHLNRAFYGGNREAALDYTIAKSNEVHGFDVSERSMKVVDEDTGELVGFSNWLFPHQFTEEENEKRLASYFMPPMVNTKLFKGFFGELLTKRRAQADEAKDFVLNLLVVRPDYQGKGVGSLLIRWGLAAADEADARCYIEASPAGYPVYRKFGWQDVEGAAIEVKLKDYGYEEMGDEVHRTPGMMRPRKSERG